MRAIHPNAARSLATYLQHPVQLSSARSVIERCVIDGQVPAVRRVLHTRAQPGQHRPDGKLWLLRDHAPTLPLRTDSSAHAELSAFPNVHSYAPSGISTRSLGLARLDGDWLPDVIADADRPARSPI